VTAAPAATAAPAVRRAAPGLIVLVVAAAFPLGYGGSSYVMSIATEALVYGLVAVTLNLLIGFGGQISLGHAGLLAVGAYAGTIAQVRVPTMPLPVELLVAAVASALAGLLIGLPTGRLRGHYLAIATLGFGLAIPQIALKVTSLTGGYTGLSMPVAHIGSWAVESPVGLYYLVLIVAGLAVLVILSLLGTSSGRAFAAVRDSEAAAAAMGINVARTKVALFTASAFFTGIAGDLFAHLQGLVAPTSFPFSLSLLFLAMVVVGGLASVWGSVAGAVLLVAVDAKAGGYSGLSPTIIGAVVVVVLLAVPGGLAALPRRLWALARRSGR